MLAIVCSIILIIVGIAVGIVLAKIKTAKLKDANDERLRYGKDPWPIPNTKIVLWPLLIAIGLSAIFIISSCLAIVPTGFTGILTTFGRVEERYIDAGANVIAPWQNVVTIDNRIQRKEFDGTAFTIDTQEASYHGSYAWQISPQAARDLYKTVGANYEETIMMQRLPEDIKIIFAKKKAEGLIMDRGTLSDEVESLFRKEMEAYQINVVDVAISDVDFTDSFTDAVEAKQKATQDKLRAETEQAQKTMEAEQEANRAKIKAQAEADQAIIAAEADLEVVKIQADAAKYAGEKEAEMNKKIAEAMTPELSQYYWIKQWDGKLPTTMLGSDTNTMVNMGDIK